MPPRKRGRGRKTQALVRDPDPESLEAKQSNRGPSSRQVSFLEVPIDCEALEPTAQNSGDTRGKASKRGRGRGRGGTRARGRRGMGEPREKEDGMMEVEQEQKSSKKRQRGGLGKAGSSGTSEGDATTSNTDDASALPPTKRRRKVDRSSKTPDSSSAIEDTDRVTLIDKPRLSPPTTSTHPISHPSHKKASGHVLMFGQGDVGQLGLGDDVMERKKPFPVGGALEGRSVVQVACGGMHTVTLTMDGKVFTWGCNDEGALGRKTEEGEEYVPGLVEKLENVPVVQVSAGDSHTAVLASNGSVYCCGVFRDSNGPFGLVTKEPSIQPELTYYSSFNKAIKIVSGSDHVVLLTEQGDVFTFGCGEQGQLGRIPECFSARGGRKGISLLLHPQVVRFRKIRGFPKPKFEDVFCGPYHTFALTQDLGVYAWGLNNYGQLGTDDDKSRYQPERLPKDWLRAKENVSLSQRVEIAGGQHHSVLCHNGSVFVMGRREYGRLGLGENCTEPQVPVRVPGLENVRSVAAGSVCSFAVTETGEAYSWGMGTNLQLGTGEEDDVWTPTRITGKKIENRHIIAASAGGQHTAILVSSQEEPLD